MTDALISVLLGRRKGLGVLDEQDAESVEVVGWDDDPWHVEVDAVARRHGWSHRRCASGSVALAAARGRFIIEWNVVEGDSFVLSRMAHRLLRDPQAPRAASSNFDPAILWNRERLGSAPDHRQLIEVDTYARDLGSSVVL